VASFSVVQVALLKVVLLFSLSACRSSALEITAAPLPSLTPILPTATPGPVEVAVDGAVYEPGSYTLLPGSLVDDAVRAAGGPTADADLARINLARVLHTGESVHVPRVGEAIPPPTPYGLSADGRVDINLADAALLETLPGVGTVIAERIIEFREMNGPFETIQDIQNVKGIGPTTFENMREQIAVSERP
jgi:competence protein ComEA